MKTKKLLLIIFLCMVAVANLSAQHKITGKIIDEANNGPIEYASIRLLTNDSVYVTGTNSDLKGSFHLDNVPSGNYYLTITFLGYSPGTVSLNGLSKSIDVGEVFMRETTNELEAVTVTASNITSKADRMIIFVTDNQKASSTNGINLLNTMNLPNLVINPLMNEASLMGDGKIQFCINGANVNLSDIRAIQPGEVIRVEYLDNPGVRYNNADVVINYILKREVTGVAVSMDLTNAVTTSFGDDQVAAKINYKKSEFGINYSLSYRKPTKVWKDAVQTFNFEDGSKLQRFQDGLPGDITENRHNIALNYNLLDEKYYFTATLRHSILDDDKMARTKQYSANDPGRITSVYQGTDSRQNLPSLDLYYSRNLKNKQTIIFNLVGTYIKSEIEQKYEELHNDQPVADILSDVEGKKYSIIGEGIYEKGFENGSRFSAGFKHNQSFADNEYSGNVNSLTKLDQADSYIYTEYAGKKNKFSYTAGVGLSRSWTKQTGEESYTHYTFRPKVSLQYNFSGNTFLRLRGEVSNSSPSLSNLSAVDQYVDTLQIIRGNPNLKPNVNYFTSMQFRWKKGIYGINLDASYTYVHKPIMEETLREKTSRGDDIFISTYDNHRNWQKLNSSITLNVGPIKNILTLSLTGGVNRYISNGNNYTHTLTNFYYRAQLMARYKKFMGIFQSGSPYDSLSGESVNGGERIHLFMLSYNTGKVSVGAGMMLPFSDHYKRFGENRNMYSPSKVHMYANNFSRMLLLKFAWNFNYGRKAKSGNKRINNQDTDSGIILAR